MELIETGGRTSLDLGLGRIVGQILVYLYLQPTACSLDELGNELGLSKASVSIAARQLEQLGLVQRVWIRGERRKYYRSAENLGQALQQGLLALVLQKVNDFGNQLRTKLDYLDQIEDLNPEDANFLKQRLERASKIVLHLENILGNPLVQILTKASEIEEKN